MGILYLTGGDYDISVFTLNILLVILHLSIKVALSAILLIFEGTESQNPPPWTMTHILVILGQRNPKFWAGPKVGSLKH